MALWNWQQRKLLDMKQLWWIQQFSNSCTQIETIPGSTWCTQCTKSSIWIETALASFMYYIVLPFSLVARTTKLVEQVEFWYTSTFLQLFPGESQAPTRPAGWSVQIQSTKNNLNRLHHSPVQHPHHCSCSLIWVKPKILELLAQFLESKPGPQTWRCWSTSHSANTPLQFTWVAKVHWSQEDGIIGKEPITPECQWPGLFPKLSCTFECSKEDESICCPS